MSVRRRAGAVALGDILPGEGSGDDIYEDFWELDDLLEGERDGGQRET